MVKLIGRKINYAANPNTWIVELAADTKEEVGPNMEIVGMPDGVQMEMLSSVMTPFADAGFSNAYAVAKGYQKTCKGKHFCYM